MTIIAVDNFMLRLAQIHELLAEIFYGDEIAAFADPFLAVQYSMEHCVDIAFVQENLRPINYTKVTNLVLKFNENAKVYLIADNLSFGDMENKFAGYLENPVCKEKIKSMLAVPA